jgi:hypothetical protein
VRGLFCNIPVDSVLSSTSPRRLAATGRRDLSRAYTWSSCSVPVCFARGGAALARGGSISSGEGRGRTVLVRTHCRHQKKIIRSYKRGREGEVSGSPCGGGAGLGGEAAAGLDGGFITYPRRRAAAGRRSSSIRRCKGRAGVDAMA